MLKTHRLLYLRCGRTCFSFVSYDSISCSHIPTTHVASLRIDFCPGPAGGLRHFETDLNIKQKALVCSVEACVIVTAVPHQTHIRHMPGTQGSASRTSIATYQRSCQKRKQFTFCGLACIFGLSSSNSSRTFKTRCNSPPYPSSFFLSFLGTQLNHWTKRVVSARIIT